MRATRRAGSEQRRGRADVSSGFRCLSAAAVLRPEDGEQRASERDDTAGVCCEATGHGGLVEDERGARSACGGCGRLRPGQLAALRHASQTGSLPAVPIAWERAEATAH